MTTKLLFAFLSVAISSRCDGQILIFARGWNTFDTPIPVIVPAGATVQDLILALCAQITFPVDLIPTVSLKHGNTELSPEDSLADVGVGPETEVTYYVRRYRFRASLEYIGEDTDFGDIFGNTLVDYNMSVPVGYGDIFKEIKEQVQEWIMSQDSLFNLTRISRDTPIGFIFYPTTSDTQLDLQCAPRLLPHYCEYYQMPESHVGQLLENEMIIKNEELVLYLRNDSIQRLRLRGDGARKYAVIEDDASVLSHQLYMSTSVTPFLSRIILWTQKPEFENVIFVHLDIPEGYDILLTPLSGSRGVAPRR